MSFKSLMDFLNEDAKQSGDDLTKKEEDKGRFNCGQGHESSNLYQKIKNEFPELKRDEFDEAVDSCCVGKSAHMELEAFEACVRRKLKLPIT